MHTSLIDATFDLDTHELSKISQIENIEILKSPLKRKESWFFEGLLKANLSKGFLLTWFHMLFLTSSSSCPFYRDHWGSEKLGDFGQVTAAKSDTLIRKHHEVKEN